MAMDQDSGDAPRRLAPVSLTAWARPLSGPEEAPRFREVWAVAEPGEPAASVLAKARLPEGLGEFLRRLDAKLDAVLGFLVEERLDRLFPLRLEVTALWAEGMEARACQASPTWPPPPGGWTAPEQWLEVVVLMDRAPLRLANAVARTRGGEHPASAMRLDFARIAGPDREALIQFVFLEERRQLRLRARQEKD